MRVFTNWLTDKVVLINGGSRGIGKEIALTFAQAGANITICSRKDPAHMTEIVDEIRKTGRQYVAIKADVSIDSDVKKPIGEVINKFNKIDILINNAGIVYWKSLLDTDEKEWNNTININLKGTYLCFRAVSQVMKKQKSGKIVNIASRLGIRPQINSSAYCISKAGL